MNAPRGAPDDPSETTPSDQDPSGAEPQSAHALTPLTPASYPAPSELSAELKRRVDDLIAELRAGRTVTCPEDTHHVVRQLAGWYSLAEDYRLAYASVQTHLERYAEEELLEAVGPRRGTGHEPARPMAVPADGMTVTLNPVYQVERDIDMEQVIRALALVAWDDATVPGGLPSGDGWDDERFGQVIAFAVEVAQRALALHGASPKPSIKAIRALATLAGARGDDDTAATVNSAVHEHGRTYKDRVRVEVKPAA